MNDLISRCNEVICNANVLTISITQGGHLPWRKVYQPVYMSKLSIKKL